MRRILIPAMCLLILGLATSSQAGALNQLFLTNDVNIIEDDDWENHVDLDDDGVITAGDYIYGMYTTFNVKNAATGDARALGNPSDGLPGAFAGVFIVEALRVLDPLTEENPTVFTVIQWKPAPVEAWDDYLGVTPTSLLADPDFTDTVALVYDDGTSPVVDAGDAGGLADAIDTATDGTLLWEIGFATNGLPNASEFWNSRSDTDDIDTVTLLDVLAALNVTHTYGPALGIQLNPHNRFTNIAGLPLVFSQVQLDGQLDTAITDPELANWSIKTDTDFAIKPTPEPGTMALLGLGLAACGAVVYRRRRKA